MFQPDAVATANVSRMRRFISLAFEGGVLDACDELIHPDCEVTDPNIPDGGWRGPALAKAMVRAVHAHFDRYTLRLDDAFAVGENHVVNRFTGHAIHRGGFLGSRAAGREVNWTGNTIYEFEAGLIRRIWIQWDMLAILIQLEVVPPPVPSTPPGWVVPAKPGMPYHAADRRSVPRRNTGKVVDPEAHKAVIRRALELASQGRGEDMIAECYSENFQREDNTSPAIAADSRSALRAYVESIPRYFGNYRIDIEDQLAAGDRVMTRFRASGVHLGGYMGITTGGQAINYTGAIIQRFEDNLIVQSWVTWDSYRLFFQLGLLPDIGRSLLA